MNTSATPQTNSPQNQWDLLDKNWGEKSFIEPYMFTLSFFLTGGVCPPWRRFYIPFHLSWGDISEPFQCRSGFLWLSGHGGGSSRVMQIPSQKEQQRETATVGVGLSSVVRALLVWITPSYTFVLSNVSVIVGFLISLFFPVNCSSPSPSSSISMTPILLSSYLQEEGEVLRALALGEWEAVWFRETQGEHQIEEYHS